MALIIVSAGSVHISRPGKNSHSLEQLAGLLKTRRSGLPEKEPNKTWVESLINAANVFPFKEGESFKRLNIFGAFRWLNFKTDAETGQISLFRMDTTEKNKMTHPPGP